MNINVQSVTYNYEQPTDTKELIVSIAPNISFTKTYGSWEKKNRMKNSAAKIEMAQERNSFCSNMFASGIRLVRFCKDRNFLSRISCHQASFCPRRLFKRETSNGCPSFFFYFQLILITVHHQ